MVTIYEHESRRERPVRAASPHVSIVVTARNYCRYLADCLRSCLAQTYDACEVIYSDDASTDDSVAIARQFADVKTVAFPEHQGVVAARNRGVSVSRGKVLIHVDGDDQLPNNFVGRHLEALTPATPFVYGPAQAFGEHASFWDVPAWGEASLWEMNFCNTSSAIWRWAFEAAGGWREASGSFWDWDLFLRASRFGEPAPSRATLLYRQHAESVSHQSGEANFARRQSMLGDVRRSAARLTIACVYSGRLPRLLPRWLEALTNAVDEAALSQLPSLVVLDNSRDPAVSSALRWECDRLAECFSSVRVLPHSGGAIEWGGEDERRHAVAQMLAGAYTRLLEETTEELVCWIEDDVLLPASGIKRLFEAITDGYPLKAAVSGLYRNRHVQDDWVAARWQDGHLQPLPADVGAQPIDVDVAGTGALMFWRDLAPPVVRSHLGPTPAHDWAFTHALRNKGRTVQLLPDVRCRHYRTEQAYV